MGVTAHRVGVDPLVLAGVAAGALVVVESAGQCCALLVAIRLRVRVVATGARHAAVAITRAVEMAFLIGKRAHTTVRQVRLIAKLRQPDRVVGGQRHPGGVARAELVLEGVALKART